MSRKVKVLLAAAVMAVTARVGWSNVIFQADFKGTGDSLVTLGGTPGQSFLSQNGLSTVSVESSNPFIPGGGSYLHVNVVDQQATARFTPLAGHGLDQLTSSSGGGITGINGGLDFFLRLDSNLTGQGNDAFRPIYVDQPSGGLNYLLANTSNDQYVRTNAQSDGSHWVEANHFLGYTANSIYHLAVTFSTDVTGVVTEKLWGVPGNTAIDTTTTAALLSTATEDFQGTGLAGFSSGQIQFGYAWSRSGSAINEDFAQFRIFNAVPATFSALSAGSVPEPASLGLFGLSAVALLAAPEVN